MAEKKRKYFGTDGIRGKANQFPMDSATVQDIASAAGTYFSKGEHKHRVLIGKDTRLSSYMIETALASGFLATGVDVFLLGPMPTPAVAQLTRSMRADLGVMISASHNPFHDNGIKFFDSRGEKLSDEIELQLEQILDSKEFKLANEHNLGRAKRLQKAAGRYIENVKNSFPRKLSLSGMKIVVDCANGASYDKAPLVLWELGAAVIAIGDKPDGFNINRKCGSTDTRALISKVLEEEADFGIALDGDADRIVACDEKGQVIDGDAIMGAIAKSWQAKGKLATKQIVATKMSNLALENFLESIGLELLRTNVGDRYVLSELRKTGSNFGGEQSGHIIFTDYSTTGDGLLAGLQLLEIIVETGLKASECLRMFTPKPQVLKNVRLEGKDIEKIVANREFNNAIDKASDKLGKEGRVLVRKSGTEPLIRIMIEGDDTEEISTLANELADICTSV